MFWLKNKVKQPLKQSFITFIFITLGFAFISSSFIFKKHILGVEIYFVPTASMYPTLKPGQFILLDTWIYSKQNPQADDIVVFKLNKREGSVALVKRISYWPDGQLNHLNQWFLLGDNKGNSHDSRSFGGIKSDQIIGQVKLILAEVNQSHQFIYNTFLNTVK